MHRPHRTRRALSVEVSRLRKQGGGLKEGIVGRRRGAGAVRHGGSQLRTRADAAPIGLCLLHADGTPVVANRPFAHLLGYDSPAELQRIASTFGIFGGPDELDGLLSTPAS